MMPNSEADVTPHGVLTNPHESSDQLPGVSDLVQSGMTSPLKIIDTSEHQSSGVDEWFPDYEAGSPWQPQAESQGQLFEQAGEAKQTEPEPLVQAESVQEPDEAARQEDQVPVDPEATKEMLQHEEELSAAEGTDPAPAAEAAPAEGEVSEETEVPLGPKHVSNDSFARTVSHQPNWMDDDEPDWNLPRAETDLFKFMPPNERTNSFPVVPQLEPQEQQQVESLPTNQAEDIINEIEHQPESFLFDDGSASQTANALQQDNFWGDDDDGEAIFPAQVGRDIQDTDEEASDARYAEGLPLINHSQADGAEEHAEAKADDPFAEDTTAEGDDFFAQIGANTNTSEVSDFPPSQLERKSTMQVMNGLDTIDTKMASSALRSPLEEEEEELRGEASTVGQATGVSVEQTTPADRAIDSVPEETKGEDLAAKWSEAFAGDDDDDFLMEDEPGAESKDGTGPDPSAFFVDDDEGFLEDFDESTSQSLQQLASPSQGFPIEPTGANSKYLPAGAAQPATAQPSNPYFPTASPMIPQAQTLAPVTPAAANPYAAQLPQQPVAAAYGVPPPRPAVSKAQSFADKAKGGYSSPYDLPMEVVKPRKRASYQQLPRGGSSAPPGPVAPPRSISMGPPAMQVPPHVSPQVSAQGPPQGPPQIPPQIQGSGSSVSPPVSSYSGQSPSLAKPPHQLQSKASFFEELPSSSKTRPASRTSNKSQPSPLQTSFNGHPQSIHPPPTSMPTPPQEPSMTASSVTSDIPRLVPPAPTNPYAGLPAATNSAPSILPPAASRYSPASSQVSMPNGAVPPPSRYSPAPPAQRTAVYGPSTSATPPSVLPHLPRTSSPLAHFEARPAGTLSEPALQPSRSTSSLYEPRLNRMPSLPPTREVEEEDMAAQLPLETPLQAASHAPPRGRQHVPPPLDSYGANAMSPPKRKISYGGASAANDIVPPPRSQTGSPGAMYGLRSPIKASEISPRPSSAQGSAVQSIASAINPVPASTASTRPRALSQKFNLIPPTDGREHDPLQRWKGVSLISWGVGGTLVTSFPVDVPRYGMNQPGPMIIRSPGEIKVKTIKEVQPLEERLAKFPGPLRGKSKKKETISWLNAGILELEKGLPNLAFQTQLSHEDKRAIERVLLWKILRVMIENDGILEGNATVDKAVRDVLSLAPTAQDEVASPVYASGNGFGGFGGESAATQMQPDSVDSGTIQRLKRSLLAGDREKAVWDAADKRLWGHALLIANTVSPDLYHKVSQEFIKKEVNFSGHNNESLAALYSVLSGNHEESVDELVPVHARAGLQLIASSTGPVNGSSLEGLEKWRETLTLILSNRSTGDAQALNSFGNLLSGYGRAEAAHICFLFARSVAVFGGLDDPRAQFVLVGADHRTQSQQFFKETEPLLLSEVYEYGLSLTGTPSLTNGVPHLSVYKLQHAMTLAEHGFRDKALQYCDMILKEMTAQTKRSPYHHLLLESAVEDLRQRILQAPNKETSSSWISKPSMNKVSDTVWSKFNKFVAGEEDAPGQGSPKFGEESGPFAGVAGGTPTISRPASVSNATGMDMFGSPNGYAAGAPSLVPTASPVLTRAASRYAPVVAQSSAAASPYEPNSAYTPSGRSSMDRTSGEYFRSSYEPRRSSDAPATSASGYMPNSLPAPAQGYSDSALGIVNQSPYQPAPPVVSTTTSAPTTGQSSGPKTPSFSPYTPYSQSSSPYAPMAQNASSHAPVAPPAGDKPATSDGMGQPYGYEPPSINSADEQPAQTTVDPASTGGYEPPSYQPYGYEPPSYEPDPETNNDTAETSDQLMSKKKSFMDDDDGYSPMVSTDSAEKTKAEKDRENEEMFRKVAEEEGKFIVLKRPSTTCQVHANGRLAKRAEAEKAAKAAGKKGWGLGSWFGGGGAAKKDSLESSPNKPIRAKLGEKSSFVYDPEQKRWVNKAGGAEDQARKSATPPPPRSMSRSATGTPPPPGPSGSAPPPRTGSTPGPAEGGASPPIGGPPGSAPPPLLRTASTASTGLPGGPPSAPPSRPATSMSNASSIDDLLGAAVPRKGGAKGKKKGGGRYVDVMAK